MNRTSDFTVECPWCEKKNDFSDEHWHDELINDSDCSNIDCMYCDFPMIIKTHTTYKLEVEPLEETI